MKDPIEQYTPTLAPPARPSHIETAAHSGTRLAEAAFDAPWRDALLRLCVELPVELGILRLTRAALDGLAPLFPGLALGVHVVAGDDERPMVVTRSPSGLLQDRDRDPARLFPRLDDEHVFELQDGVPGSTFHVGCPAGEDSPFDLELCDRAALVLGSAIARARAHGRALSSSRHADALKAQLIQAEKLASLGQIVAGVVHELNNPLTSILAYAEYLERRLATGTETPDDAERARRIGEAAERVRRFACELVAYARPSSETRMLVHLGDVIEKALLFCEHELSLGGVLIERGVPEDLPPLPGIGTQLTQVFVNLFTNAVHAMSGQGGVLRVSAELDLGEMAVVVQVSDTGSGIAAEHLPRIFEPFFTTKPQGRGTGLGLSIVRDIIDAHGGTLGVHSELGSGATFSLTLPLPTSLPPPATLPSPL